MVWHRWLIPLTFLGARLTSAFAGATTFAAMFVLMVASTNPTRDIMVGSVPSIRLTTATGSDIAFPKIETVADVTATPKNEKSAMNKGKPMAWPLSCDACDLA